MIERREHKEQATMARERRMHARTATRKGYLVGCKTAASNKTGGASNLATKLLDVSARGACIVTHSRLRPGIPVLLMVVPPGGKDRFEARAVVRWSTSVESKGRVAHVAGLEFDRAIPALAPSVKEIQPREMEAPAVPDPQRKHKRFSPERVEVVCIAKGFKRTLGIKTNIARAMKNVSVGGAQIVSDRKLKPGARVELTLQFRYPPGKVASEGIVRWCRRNTLSVEPRWDVGVSFIQMDRDSSGHLREIERVYLANMPSR